MKELRSLKDLLFNEIQVMYSAETLLVAAMPRMIEKAHDPELKQALNLHLEETRQQAERLKNLCNELGIDPDDDGNASMKGLIAESEKVMHKDAAPAIMDATIIAGAQKIEHYEISGYGTAAYMAEELRMSNVAEVLRMNLSEEKKTDDILNRLAKSKINLKAESI